MRWITRQNVKMNRVAVDTEGNYANQSHSIFQVTKKEPRYVIKRVTTIATGKWVTVTLSMI